MPDASGMAGRVHVFPVRVYYEDTDAAGIVYYANYLRFAERARTELMRELGAEHSRMAEVDGVMFAVRRCVADYLKPARLDDLLEVRSRLLAIGGASLEAEQLIARDGDTLVRIGIRLACIDRAGRPARIPRHVRDSLGLVAPRAGRNERT